jgi:polysaccharide biosynthesis/export protein
MTVSRQVKGGLQMHRLEGKPQGRGRHRRFAAGRMAAVIVMLASASVGWAQSSKGTAGSPARPQNQSANQQTSSANPITPTPSSAATADNYVIGPEDVLSINVWKDPEVSGSVPVRPDGRITLALLGDLVASGRTPSQLAAEIRNKLKDYVLDPRVQVIVTQVKSRSFNIVGKVSKPGAYDLAKPTTVLDAVALAGGFQDFAKVNKVYVLRKMPDGSQKMLPFRYKEVIKGRQLDENIQLQNGDTVVVP